MGATFPLLFVIGEIGKRNWAYSVLSGSSLFIRLTQALQNDYVLVYLYFHLYNKHEGPKFKI